MAKKKTENPPARRRRRKGASGTSKIVWWQVLIGAVVGYASLELVDEIPFVGSWLKRLRERGKPVNVLLFVVFGALALNLYFSRSRWSSVALGMAGGPIVKGLMDAAEKAEQTPATAEGVGAALGQFLDAWPSATTDERIAIRELLGVDPDDQGGHEAIKQAYAVGAQANADGIIDIDQYLAEREAARA